MPLQKILLKLIALAIFIIFIVAFIRDYSKPAVDNRAFADNFVTDTSGKPGVDSLDTLRIYLPSSKSMILRKDNPLPVYSFPKKKDTTRRMRMHAPMLIIQDTAKTSAAPKK